MGKRIRDYIKYTLSELENYTKTEGSCVKKINTPIHLNFPPYGLSNFRQTLLNIIAQNKIGFYDAQLKGIILDIKNIKVLGDIGALRFDDPSIHLNIQADCYVFQPQIGAIVRGMVKHISHRHVGVIIYRVFSVTIRLEEQNKHNIELNSEVEFRIKKFDLQNVMPFIEGEYVRSYCDSQKRKNTIIKLDEDENIKDESKKSIKIVHISDSESDGDEKNVKKEPAELKQKIKKSDTIHPKKLKFIENGVLKHEKSDHESLTRSLSPDLFEDEDTIDSDFVTNQKQNLLKTETNHTKISPKKEILKNGIKTETHEILDSDSDVDTKPTRKRKTSIGSIPNEAESSSSHSKRNRNNIEENQFKKSSVFSKILNRKSEQFNGDVSQSQVSFSQDFKIPLNDSTTSTQKKKKKSKHKDLDNEVTEIITLTDDEIDVKKRRKKSIKKEVSSEVTDSLLDLFAKFKSEK